MTDAVNQNSGCQSESDHNSSVTDKILKELMSKETNTIDECGVYQTGKDYIAYRVQK